MVLIWLNMIVVLLVVFDGFKVVKCVMYFLLMWIIGCWLVKVGVIVGV